MKILPPIDVTPANLTSNVAITETEWTAGTYNTGDQRYVDTTLYEVVASPSTTDSPTDGVLADPPTWIEIGAINRFKMFDLIIGDATEQSSGDIVVTIDSGSEVYNGVALFNVSATSVQVEVIDAVDGVVYDKTIDMTDYVGINNWYNYFFLPYDLNTSAIFTDLPAYVGADIRVTVSSGGGDISVGELVVGRTKDLGVTLANFEFGIEDFSRKERDEFGRFVIVERRFAKTANYDVLLFNNQVNATFRALSEVRATPVVYIGSDDKTEATVLGFYKDFRTLRTGPFTSEMSLEVEGLV
jgi:hypothetical protein